MIATLANMRKHYREGVFAWSPDTGEEYSADPGDYFAMSEDSMLRDDNGEPMVLAYRTTSFVILGEEL